MNDDPDRRGGRKSIRAGEGAIVGAGVGMMLGAAFGNPGVGLVPDAVLGMALGVGIAR